MSEYDPYDSPPSPVHKFRLLKAELLEGHRRRQQAERARKGRETQRDAVARDQQALRDYAASYRARTPGASTWAIARQMLEDVGKPTDRKSINRLRSRIDRAEAAEEK